MLTLVAGTRLVHEIEIKRSRFITSLARTDTPEDARAFIDEVRGCFPDARHNCSAYLLHEPGRNPIQHSSDDGEPAGTAGVPMLDALRQSGVWNATAVVTRYFGGVLLGAGGLIRAYSTSVSEALALAPRAEVRSLTMLECHLNPANAGRVEADLRSAGAVVTDVVWGRDVSLRIACDAADVDVWKERLASATRGAGVFEPVGHTAVEVPVGRGGAVG